MILSKRRLIAAAATLPAALCGRKLLAASGSLAPRLDDMKAPGTEVPAIEFTTADGATRTLKDYLGSGIVLNFWATWCVPCVAEMPELAKLAALVADANVHVLPLSSDRGGAAAVARYFAEKSILGLPVLLDARGAAARAFGTRGIPTTVLIDAKGRERGRLEGAAEWGSPEAVKAVKALG